MKLKNLDIGSVYRGTSDILMAGMCKCGEINRLVFSGKWVSFPAVDVCLQEK